jgi:hypothetical protein
VECLSNFDTKIHERIQATFWLAARIGTSILLTTYASLTHSPSEKGALLGGCWHSCDPNKFHGYAQIRRNTSVSHRFPGFGEIDTIFYEMVLLFLQS